MNGQVDYNIMSKKKYLSFLKGKILNVYEIVMP